MGLNPAKLGHRVTLYRRGGGPIKRDDHGRISQGLDRVGQDVPAGFEVVAGSVQHGETGQRVSIAARLRYRREEAELPAVAGNYVQVVEGRAPQEWYQVQAVRPAENAWEEDELLLVDAKLP